MTDDMGVFFSHHAVVGTHEVTRWRIDDPRQFVRRDESIPARPSIGPGHTDGSVESAPDRNFSHERPGNVPIGVREHHIVRRPAGAIGDRDRIPHRASLIHLQEAEVHRIRIEGDPT